MNFDESKSTPDSNSDKAQNAGFLKQNGVAIYTLLVILLKIKRNIGLEGMLDYIESYQKLIEKSNPEFSGAVEQALSLMSVEKMYRDVTKNAI